MNFEAMTDKQEVKIGLKMILKAFYRGAENVTIAEELGERIDRSAQSTRNIINELRKEGVPICSTKAGFFYADTVEDIDATIAHLESRVTDILACVDGLRRARRELA